MLTCSPALTRSSATTPSAGALTVCSIFIASRTRSGCPAVTTVPGSASTRSTRPGIGASRDPAGVSFSGSPKRGISDTYVDASDGSTALSETPRFGDPAKLAPAGSLLAPMPGLVLRVLAEPGAVVTAGQPILVLEAMKMEQTVSAPADGVLAELRAKAGEQVSTGQVLAVLETPGQ